MERLRVDRIARVASRRSDLIKMWDRMRTPPGARDLPTSRREIHVRRLKLIKIMPVPTGLVWYRHYFNTGVF
jgi:hypothetical protein